jgi:hypothetical protein
MRPNKDANDLRRLFAREAVLEAELRAVRAKQAETGNRLSFANGYAVPLRGPALKRLAEGA